MTSLNITHGVRDFDEWLATFKHASMRSARRAA